VGLKDLAVARAEQNGTRGYVASRGTTVHEGDVEDGGHGGVPRQPKVRRDQRVQEGARGRLKVNHQGDLGDGLGLYRQKVRLGFHEGPAGAFILPAVDREVQPGQQVEQDSADGFLRDGGLKIGQVQGHGQLPFSSSTAPRSDTWTVKVTAVGSFVSTSSISRRSSRPRTVATTSTDSTRSSASSLPRTAASIASASKRPCKCRAI